MTLHRRHWNAARPALVAAAVVLGVVAILWWPR